MTEYQAKQHFVTFKSPGMPASQQTTRPVDNWDTLKAVDIAYEILESRGSIPYGFHFTTRARTADELDSSVIAQSRTYFMGGKVETLEDVMKDPITNKVLIDNMKINHWDKVITTDRGYSWTTPFRRDDTVLDMTSL